MKIVFSHFICLAALFSLNKPCERDWPSLTIARGFGLETATEPALIQASPKGACENPFGSVNENRDILRLHGHAQTRSTKPQVRHWGQSKQLWYTFYFRGFYSFLFFISFSFLTPQVDVLRGCISVS